MKIAAIFTLKSLLGAASRVNCCHPSNFYSSGDDTFCPPANHPTRRGRVSKSDIQRQIDRPGDRHGFHGTAPASLHAHAFQRHDADADGFDNAHRDSSDSSRALKRIRSFGPRIENRHSERLEIVHVSRRDREIVLHGRGGDQSVG